MENDSSSRICINLFNTPFDFSSYSASCLIEAKFSLIGNIPSPSVLENSVRVLQASPSWIWRNCIELSVVVWLSFEWFFTTSIIWLERSLYQFNADIVHSGGISASCSRIEGARVVARKRNCARVKRSANHRQTVFRVPPSSLSYIVYLMESDDQHNRNLSVSNFCHIKHHEKVI